MVVLNLYARPKMHAPVRGSLLQQLTVSVGMAPPAYIRPYKLTRRDKATHGRTRGRPPGQFITGATKLLNLMKRLQRPYCHATTGWLANAMRCSPRQVTRYLTHLKKCQLIRVVTERLWDVPTKSFYMRRQIWMQDSASDSEKEKILKELRNSWSPRPALTQIPVPRINWNTPLFVGSKVNSFNWRN